MDLVEKILVEKNLNPQSPAVITERIDSKPKTLLLRETVKRRRHDETIEERPPSVATVNRYNRRKLLLQKNLKSRPGEI